LGTSWSISTQLRNQESVKKPTDEEERSSKGGQKTKEDPITSVVGMIANKYLIVHSL
jgi:hypothetical protein